MVAHTKLGPLAPISNAANIEIAKRIVRRIAGFRTLQPGAWQDYAPDEIANHLNAASGPRGVRNG